SLERAGGDLKDAAENFGDWVMKLGGGSTIDRARQIMGGSSASSGTIQRTPAGAAPYMNDIKMASLRYNIPEEVLIGMMRTESSFNPNAKNSIGASGLMGIMPDMRKVLNVP